MTPIEMIARHTEKGIMHPVKYKITEGEEITIVCIDRVLTRSEEKSFGCIDLIFGCQGVINGCMKKFELKYKVPECKWLLYKI